MSEFSTYVVIFTIYTAAMIGISLAVYRRNKDLEDYVLGGRQLNSWVAALSATASDMSAWMLIGLPGAAYASGLDAAWIPVGLIIGLYVSWKVIAPRLRVYTERATSFRTGEAGNALTLSAFFENRFQDRSRLLRLISAAIIVVFFTIGVAAELVAGVLVFDIVFGTPPFFGIIITISIIMVYTLIGGFLAVSYTDSVQAALMWVAAIVVPVVAIVAVGGFTNLFEEISARNPDLLSLGGAVSFADASWLSAGTISAVTIISGIAWGWGYFGQPHILARFMAIRSTREIPSARRIAVGMSGLGMLAAVATGLVGIAYFTDPLSNAENVFLRLLSLFPTWLEGLFLVGLLAALMSTASSMLLVAVSALTDDLYGQFINTNATGKHLLWVGRVLVIVVAVVACLIALQGGSVLDIVAYSWAGLGAAFGSVLLVSLLWRNMNRAGAMAGMIGGGVTVLVYKQIDTIGLYEMVPGVLVSLICIFIFNRFGQAPSDTMNRDFEHVTNTPTLR